jgi:hypothetical protein
MGRPALLRGDGKTDRAQTGDSGPLATGLTADGRNRQKCSSAALYRNVDEAIGIVNIPKRGSRRRRPDGPDLEKKNDLLRSSLRGLFAQMAAAQAFRIGMAD